MNSNHFKSKDRLICLFESVQTYSGYQRMSLKPKQQQANLFSFFKKSDKALETPVEKKLPDNSSPAPTSAAKNTITPSASVVNSAEKPSAALEGKAAKVTPEVIISVYIYCLTMSC